MAIYKKLVLLKLITILITFSILYMFNLTVDPYGLKKSDKLESKIIFSQSERIKKIVLSKNFYPEKIFLGTSTVRDGITKDLYDEKTLNVSFNSQSPFESYNLLIHLNKKNLKEVNIGLDFFIFSKYWEETLYQRGFNENIYDAPFKSKIRKLKLNLSKDTLNASLLELKYGNDLFLSKSEAKDFFYNFQNTDFEKFDLNKIIYYQKKLRQFNYDENFEYSKSKSKFNSFDSLIKIIKICKKKKIKINLIINPTHRSEKFLLSQIGLKDNFLHWTKFLYKIAKDYDIDLINLSSINGYTDAKISQFNHNFSDPIHFRLNLSNFYMNEIKLNHNSLFYYKNLSHSKFKINYEHEIDSFKDELGVSLGRVIEEISFTNFVGIEVNE